MTNHQSLIADSGSTKTDWALINSGSDASVRRLTTQGINPFHQEASCIRCILTEELLPQLDAIGRIERIRFYGSGVRPEQQGLMESLLSQSFPSAKDVQARGDLLGAARALYGNKMGIACILGTGANSCVYDGHGIVANTPPLGYILGDEGSGAVLGRNFLNALYKGRLEASLRESFEQWAGMTMDQVITRVYRQPLANRWLASLSVYIHAHLDSPSVESLVIDNFRDFIHHNILPYERNDLPLRAVGSIAFHYQKQLDIAAREQGISLDMVMRSPIDGLISAELRRFD